MGFIKVTPEQLRHQAGQITSGAGEVQDLLNRLLGQVHDLASSWEGAGGSKFQQLYDEWQQGAAMTKQGMEGIASFLNAAAQQYEDTDSAIAGAGS